jgi:hypothetical protein
VPHAIVRPVALTEEPAGAELVVDQGDTIKGKISRCVCVCSIRYGCPEGIEIEGGYGCPEGIEGGQGCPEGIEGAGKPHAMGHISLGPAVNRALPALHALPCSGVQGRRG